MNVASTRTLLRLDGYPTGDYAWRVWGTPVVVTRDESVQGRALHAEDGLDLGDGSDGRGGLDVLRSDNARLEREVRGLRGVVAGLEAGLAAARSRCEQLERDNERPCQRASQTPGARDPRP